MGTQAQSFLIIIIIIIIIIKFARGKNLVAKLNENDKESDIE